MYATKKLLALKENINILQLIPNYPVPRYTSYPTTPNFNEKINNDKYSLWLKKIKKNKKISLYIHIPFCNSLCYFLCLSYNGSKQIQSCKTLCKLFTKRN